LTAPVSANVLLRNPLGRPMTYEEMDENLTELKNVIDQSNTDHVTLGTTTTTANAARDNLAAFETSITNTLNTDITNLQTATNNHIRSGDLNIAVDSGTANAIVLTCTPAITSLTDKLTLTFTANSTNTTATTIKVDALSAIPLLGQAQLPTTGGEITPSTCVVEYNSALNSFILLFCAGGEVQIPKGTKDAHAVRRDQLTGGSAGITGLGNYQSAIVTSVGSTLTIAQAGSLIKYNGTATTTITLPLASDIPGGSYKIWNSSFYSVSLASASAFVGPCSSTLLAGCEITVISDGTNWVCVGGVGLASLNANGYQKLPSGLIIQWGYVSASDWSTNTEKTITLPITYPTICLSVLVSARNAAFAQIVLNGRVTSTSTIAICGYNIAGNPFASTVAYFTIGY